MIEKKPAKSILLALTLVAVIALSTFLLHAQTSLDAQVTPQTEAQSESHASRGSLRELQAQRLEGAWAYTVTPVVPPGVPQPPSQRAFITIARGGGLSVYIRTGPNGPFYGEQHGVWEYLGGNEYALTAIRDEFDAQGNFLGTGKINTKLRLTGRDGFIGVGSREFRDPAGNVADIIRCATIKAERIKIELLAPQCQSITPPR
jgi:hypothetical protein